MRREDMQAETGSTLTHPSPYFTANCAGVRSSVLPSVAPTPPAPTMPTLRAILC